MVTTSALQTLDTLTWGQHQLMGLAEKHAEVDGALASISESYTATAMRYDIPAIIDTGKFRPRKGDPIFIRVDKVINDQPWKKYLKLYVPQYDHSFLSRAYFLVHPDYCDFLIRGFTPRFRNPSDDVQNKLTLLSQITSIEKINKEKYLAGPTAFACHEVYELMHQCYQLRGEYVERRKIVNKLALRYKWSEVRKEYEFVQARKECHERAEALRRQPLPSLEPLPPGTPRIILIGQGDEHDE